MHQAVSGKTKRMSIQQECVCVHVIMLSELGCVFMPVCAFGSAKKNTVVWNMQSKSCH